VDYIKIIQFGVVFNRQFLISAKKLRKPTISAVASVEKNKNETPRKVFIFIWYDYK
jgi:hypothetical protein